MSLRTNSSPPSSPVASESLPLYDELRELGQGVRWADELGGWLCTRYDEDVRRIYTDHETFSSDYYFDQRPGCVRPGGREHRRFLDIFLQQFMLTDPPAHTEVRRLLRSAFTPRSCKVGGP